MQIFSSEERNLQENTTQGTGNLIGAKVYFDGSQWIAIPHTERPYRKRGNKIRAKPRHKWEKSIQNSFFNERFGRSDFDAIDCSKSVSDSVNYMLKYLSKSDEKVTAESIKLFSCCFQFNHCSPPSEYGSSLFRTTWTLPTVTATPWR